MTNAAVDQFYSELKAHTHNAGLATLTQMQADMSTSEPEAFDIWLEMQDTIEELLFDNNGNLKTEFNSSTHKDMTVNICMTLLSQHGITTRTTFVNMSDQNVELLGMKYLSNVMQFLYDSNGNLL